jgi:RNA polymerase sigma-70 factor, ECF subfamily
MQVIPAIYNLDCEAADPIGRHRPAAVVKPSSQADTDSDEWLLQRCGQGDSAALEKFYRNHADKLYSVALKMLFTAEDAQDVLQEAFLKIWNKAESYNPKLSTALTWATLQVRSLCLDRMRKIHRHANKLERINSLTAWAPPASVDSALPRAELAEQIHTAMELLSLPERQCVTLAIFSEMTHAEVAETLGHPLGSTKSRLCRGMNKLRALLRSSHES